MRTKSCTIIGRRKRHHHQRRKNRSGESTRHGSAVAIRFSFMKVTDAGTDSGVSGSGVVTDVVDDASASGVG